MEIKKKMVEVYEYNHTSYKTLELAQRAKAMAEVEALLIKTGDRDNPSADYTDLYASEIWDHRKAILRIFAEAYEAGPHDTLVDAFGDIFKKDVPK